MTTYDAVVMSGPVLYLPSASPIDATGRHQVVVHGTPGTGTLPNGDSAPTFDGVSSFWEVPDAADLSPVTKGALTVSAWVDPSVLTFPNSTGDYIHLLGKGVPSQHEWAWRMYNAATPATSPPRPSRMSTYVWPLSGALGSGCYVQEPVTVGQPMHFVSVIDLTSTPEFSMGKISWYKNGAHRMTVGLTQYATVMGDGTAPLRIGTRDLASYFAGTIGKLAIWDRPLNGSEIAALHSAMTA